MSIEVVAFLKTIDNFELSTQQITIVNTTNHNPPSSTCPGYKLNPSGQPVYQDYCRIHADVNQTCISAHTIDSTYRDPLPPADIPHLVVDGTPPDKSTLSTWLCRLRLKPKMAYVKCHEQVFFSFMGSVSATQPTWMENEAYALFTYKARETHGSNSWFMVNLDTRLVLCVSVIHSVSEIWQKYVVCCKWQTPVNRQLVHGNQQSINYRCTGQTLRCSDRIHSSAARRIICLLSSISLFISYLIVITVLPSARLQALSCLTACIQAAAK
jgi:hypothetical protein